jgi:hypothetical protein
MKEEKIFYVLVRKNKNVLKKKVIILREPLINQEPFSCESCPARLTCSFFLTAPSELSIYSDVPDENDLIEDRGWLSKPLCGDRYYKVLDCIVMKAEEEGKFAIVSGRAVYPEGIIEFFCKQHCSHYCPGLCCFNSKECPMSDLFKSISCEIVKF